MSFYPFYNKIIAEKGLFVHPGTVCDILTSFLRIYVGQIVVSSRSGAMRPAFWGYCPEPWPLVPGPLIGGPVLLPTDAPAAKWTTG